MGSEQEGGKKGDEREGGRTDSHTSRLGSCEYLGLTIS